MNFYKRIIISFLIIVSIFGVCVLYVKINELYWVNLVKKASKARLESF